MKKTNIGWKEFLAPTPFKLILIAFIFVMVFLLGLMERKFDVPDTYGFPLVFWEIGGYIEPEHGYINQFNLAFLVIDLIFWYLISAAIIFAASRRSNK